MLAIILLYNFQMKDTLARITSDPRYVKNIEYGEPRPGHPEGKVKYHITELEANLEKLALRLTQEQYWKLKFLIHVHDSFKAEAVPNARIESPHSHASLAKKFASEFTDDSDLLAMIQYHDLGFALWKQFAANGVYDLGRFQTLFATIIDWELFLLFLIIDGCTQGKHPETLRWFIREVRKHKKTDVDETWLLQDK